MRPGREKIKHMRSDLVEKASEIVPDPPVLINMVSRRVRQLNMGRQPLVPIMGRMGTADIALTEIIEGKVAIDDLEDDMVGGVKKASKKSAKK